jgi:hypothetical protein
VTPARADRTTRLDHDSWPGKALGRTRRVQRIVDEVPERIEIQLRVAGHIRDTMSATDVQLGQFHPVTGTDLGHQWHHLSDGFAVERSVGHLRTDMTLLQTGQVK